MVGWLRGTLLFLAATAAFLMLTTLMVMKPRQEEPLMMSQLHQQTLALPLLDSQQPAALQQQQHKDDTRAVDDGMIDTLMLLLSTHKMRKPPQDNLVNMVVTWPYLLDLQREGVTQTEKNVRQQEFTDTVWRNLHHERVWSIHVLYEKGEHIVYLLKTLKEIAASRKEGDTIDSLISTKTFLTKLPDNRMMQYKDAFEYANKYLPGLLYFLL